jgi:hypothetical protein
MKENYFGDKIRRRKLVLVGMMQLVLFFSQCAGEIKEHSIATTPG